MDTNRLKRFATDARNSLMRGVEGALKSIGFNKDDGSFIEEPVLHGGGSTFMGVLKSEDFYWKWKALQHAVNVKSIREVKEEAAYTWFNRFVAIRILSKNGLISPQLEYQAENIRIPVIVTNARRGILPQIDDVKTWEKIQDLLRDDSKTDEQFRELIVAFCHSNKIIDKCFGAISDYTELLLPQNILAGGGFVEMLNSTGFLTHEDFLSPELIGWLYQFYISERKDEVFAKKGKYDADEIPAATQIFTPNWIVKYMVQNTVGRIYLDNNPWEEELKAGWKYLVEPTEKPADDVIYRFDRLEDLKVADLACGSGHILNECFDLLFQLYRNEGYSSVDAVTNIFTHNLSGIDIDTRAKQLATFALLLKACQKDRSFADAHCMPRIYDMPEPYAHDNALLHDTLPHFFLGCSEETIRELIEAINVMNDARTLGSIMKFKISDRTRSVLEKRVYELEAEELAWDGIHPRFRELMPYMKIILALTEKYSAIIMNPPYMGSGNMNSVLGKYVEKNYKDGKADLFSTFMILANDRLADKGKYSMITMQSWMFLTSFEKLRKSLLDSYHIENMLHLGPRTFDELSGEVVQNTAFVIGKAESASGSYYRLLDGRNCADKERMFLAREGIYPNVSQSNFGKIPGHPLGYWVSERMIELFNFKLIKDYCYAGIGMRTGDNNRFLRLWYEVPLDKCTMFNPKINKWTPYNKGGEFRRWYGNNDYVVNWENDGFEIKENTRLTYPELGDNLSWKITNEEYYFRPGITWTGVSTKKFNCRMYGSGFIFDSGANGLFPNEGVDTYHVLAYLNCKIANEALSILNPTINYGSGTIRSIPFLPTENSQISILSKQCQAISKSDWDAHETSWDFKTNDIVERCELERARRFTIEGETVEIGVSELEDFMKDYKRDWESRFAHLHANEEELNRQFIEIYGLQDELTPDVPLDEVTILQQGEISIRDNQIVWHDDVIIKQIISYAIGCMMGRYSIDRPGLILANQGDGLNEFKALVPDSRFNPDEDGIIPLMTDSEFSDNATARFKEWLRITFGEENLVTNLNFVEKCLGKTIGEYFAKSFWPDHKKMYQNRPVYWLFSSRRGAFQCLVYMHRMNPYTIERIRSKYLLPHIEWLNSRQKSLQDNSANLSSRERRELDAVSSQLAECREYHERLHDVADRQIPIDLDDGVLVNYAKFGDVLSKLK